MTAPQIRVVHFGKYYPPHRGGMETFLSDLCNGLVKRNIHCTVIVSSDGNSGRMECIDGLQLYKMRRYGEVKSLPICPESLTILRKTKADIIHLHHPNPLADLSYLMTLPCSSRLVVTYHADVLNKGILGLMNRPFQNMILKRADVIIATSQDYADASPILRTFAEKVRVIPLGISLSSFDRFNGDMASSANSEPQYFFLGRLVGYKGVSVLIDALKTAPGRLWIGGDGPLECELRNQVRQFKLDSRIQFLGEISDEEKLKRLTSCDAFVLPSITRAEAFGIVLLEAMAMRRPVIASDLAAGPRLLVEQGVNGFLFPPGDVAALSLILCRFAERKDRFRNLGEEGRKRVERFWTVDRMVDRYVDLYKGLIDSIERRASHAA